MGQPFFVFAASLLIALAVLAIAAPGFGQAAATLKIDTQTVEYTMKGGIGASWHAIRRPGPWKSADYDYPPREINPRGSALEGNPPLENEHAWNQLLQLNRWLGLNWIRVELAQLMYEPQKGHFEWDNDEMRTLYRILDYCQNNDVDVFLQQMWTEVAWNSFPGVHPLISAPRSLEDYGNGLAELVDHLVNHKKYNCIKWLCITNEPPGGTWGYWWTSGSHPCVSLTSAFKAVREALDRKGLKTPISGPDWTDLPTFDAAKLDFDPYLGAYDIHSYQGVRANEQHTLAQWAAWAHAHGKPLFLSEMGDMRLGWGGSNPGPRTFAAALSNAETIIRGIRAGVDGFNRWSYVNRGDLDGQWQLVRTYDIGKRDYYAEVTPEPVAYYGYAIMTRFLSKCSSRLKDELTGPESDLLTVTMKSPTEHLTTYLLNRGSEAVRISIRYEGLKQPVELGIYQAAEVSISKSDYRMNPIRLVSLDSKNADLSEILPAFSITAITSYRLRHADNGVLADKPPDRPANRIPNL